ncbi:uncharacterized protein THITE_44080 [Thermothielavioides terrestris NRRL 8126]|uniref:DUF1749-domain-containing protein n=1 Tax=Thermothielavioides terrestris (strain ATCC 38088 / NRRL 8126) TaxID=578455 RepID=G2RBP0_THETT|nr:uncharacterized protein THITE_44080 [Thermothielavioides terrestris NRRL 8126]AEO69211.1 hypothetical protein THITE_44080 [Thermothielavioides terrestris NRRL 8126]
MSSSITLPPPYPVKVHSYLPLSSSTSSPAHPLQAYEHLPDYDAQASPPSTQPPPNVLVFIGGLGDGPHTIPYVRHLATYLSSSSNNNNNTPATASGSPAPRYRVFEARLTSAFSAFGYGSLAQDARELAALVRHLRGPLVGARRVVLMGHSTGCQDCLEYVGREGWAEEGEGLKVDGLVLQGPVSDREAIGMTEDKREVEAALRVAERMVREGRGGEVMATGEMPSGWRGSPVTAYRWASLAGVGGDDDYFSSDLPDEKLESVWGRLEQPVLILPSEKDEWVPADTDVMGLVNRWKSFCKPGIASDLSGLIPGANHRVDNPAGQEWLADRVARFLAELEK